MPPVVFRSSAPLRPLACAGNGEGFWLFTREPVASAETVAQLRSIAAGKGFDLSVLKPVVRALEMR